MRSFGVRHAAGALAGALALASCNADPIQPATPPTAAGSWDTVCPAGQSNCVPNIELNLLQSGTTVFGEGSITLIFPSGPGSPTWVDQTTFLEGTLTGTTLTMTIKVRRSTSPDFLPDSATGTLTGTVTGTSAARGLHAKIVIPATAHHTGYTAERDLVLDTTP